MSTVTLRDVAESDLLTLFEHQLEPVAVQMAAFPSRDKDAFMKHWANVLVDDTVVKKVILFDGEVVGNIVSFERLGHREVGYWIDKPHWGRGIASAALSQFLGEVPHRPLHAHVFKHNVASLRVLQKCGFAITGEDRFVGASGEQHQEFVLTLA